MLYLPYELSDSCFQFYLKIRIPKKNFFLSLTPFCFHSALAFPCRFHIFLSSSFSISPRSFLSVSLRFTTSIPHVLNCLSLLIAHSAPCFFSFHPISVFSLLLPTSKSRHYFSFSCALSPQVLRNFLCHTALLFCTVVL
jgi:hypothetical protein